MENITKNRYFKVLFWMFIVISLIHIIYATITMRGLYADGTYYLFSSLHHFTQGTIKTSFDPTHPRAFIELIHNLPITISYYILQIKSKYALILIYCASLVALPFLTLLWNYKLSHRTKRYDIFYWSLFNYGAITIMFSIFPIVEAILGSALNFVLWNYMASNIEYKKRDIFAILFLLVVMFQTYEYIAYVGILFFLASIYYAKKAENKKNKFIKLSIGITSLFASIYNFLFFFSQDDSKGDIFRVLKEFYDWIPWAHSLNILITVTAIALMILILWRKTQIKSVYIAFCTLIFTLVISRLFLNTQMSIYPMWETHLRTIHYAILPLTFIILFTLEFINKEKKNILYSNILLITLMCASFQTMWQIVETYYWDKNIQYLKQELKSTDEYILIPTLEREIASFHNPELRRFIWHGTFPTLSILLSETKEQKPLLLTHETVKNDADREYHEEFFVYEGNENINLPVVGAINTKTIFWDLTKATEALDKYHKEHNIHRTNPYN